MPVARSRAPAGDCGFKNSFRRHRPPFRLRRSGDTTQFVRRERREDAQLVALRVRQHHP